MSLSRDIRQSNCRSASQAKTEALQVGEVVAAAVEEAEEGVAMIVGLRDPAKK